MDAETAAAANPSHYRATRCTGSSNYPAEQLLPDMATGTCSACQTTQKLTKTGLVKAHDKKETAR